MIFRYYKQFTVNCMHTVYCKRKIQTTFTVAKVNYLGRQPDVKAKFFWQDFRKWKSVMISDYTQSVLRREEKCGKEKTQLNLDAIPLTQSQWLSTDIRYVSDGILCGMNYPVWSSDWEVSRFFIFSRWQPSAILDVFATFLNHPQSIFGDLYSWANFGCNSCNSFDNMKLWIFCVFGLKMPIHSPKIALFGGDLTPKWGGISTEPSKGTPLLVSSRSGEASSRTAISGYFTLLYLRGQTSYEV